MDRNNNYNTRKILNPEQTKVRDEFVNLHNLDASQISFEGDRPTPIFDYEAVNTLSLRLTDIQSIEPTRVEQDGSTVTVYCIVTLPDGRTRGAFASCDIGETLYDEEVAANRKLAEATATSRAFRRGIRSVGINLLRAHEEWKKSGSPASASLSTDPRNPMYQELNAIANRIGLKSKQMLGGEMVEDRDEYERIIAEQFDGRRSAKELNDLELNRLVWLFRTLDRLHRNDELPKAA